jgi:hypothetical protein
MHTSSHTIRRLAAALGLAGAVAALAVPAALAGVGPSPDNRDAATAQSIPRVGNGVFGPAVPTPSGPVTISRSPDTADAAVIAHSPIIALTKQSTFAWREFGIGAAAAAGAILLLLGVTAGLLAGRGRGEVAHPTVSA